MSKKFYIIIAVILVLFFIALGGYYFILQSNEPGNTSVLPSFRDFFPFGGNTPATSTTTPAVVQQQQDQNQNFAQKLRKIWADPVAGFGIFDVRNKGVLTGIVVRHIDTATGHIYETDMFSPRQDRVSNTTIPTVYTALWGSDQNTLIAQYLADDNQTVNTYQLSLQAATTTTSDGKVIITNDYRTLAKALPARITSVVVSSSTIFYLTQTNFSSVGFISNIQGGTQKQIWNSQITELLPQFVNSTTVALTTKPYQNMSGYVYFVNTSTGATKKVLGDIPGLSTLTSPDAKRVLALSQSGSDRLFAYTVADQSSQNLTPTTFPEKCVWSKINVSILYCAVPHESLDDSSLTDWYMGAVQFSDDIWRYDLTDNTSHVIESLASDAGEFIDVENLALSQNEQYLVFKNKIDGALWSLDLIK